MDPSIELVPRLLLSGDPVFNRDTYRLPIHTLRLPFARIYVVNATELIPALQKQWRFVSFAALTARAGHLVGLSKEGNELLARDVTSEYGFSPSWPKYIMSAMGAGEELDSMNRTAIELFAQEMDRLRADGAVTRIGLWQWAREMMVKCTTEAVWGPENPYRDAAVAQAWE